MAVVPGRNGGTLKQWEKGQSGNPKGRVPKGISFWKDQLENKKKFVLKLEMEDEDGEITTIERTLTLNESVSKMAATQLWIKAAEGDLEAIRVLVSMEQASADRHDRYQKDKEDDRGDTHREANMLTLFDPTTKEVIDLTNIGGADNQTT